MSTVVTWLLLDESSDEVRMPVVDINRVLSKVNARSDIKNSNLIAQGGVIKREYLTHDIMAIIGIYDNSNIPPYTDYEKGARYFNSTEKKLYLRWTGGWIQPTTPDIERMFVNLSDGKLYRFYNGDLVEVGASSGLGQFTLVDAD